MTTCSVLPFIIRLVLFVAPVSSLSVPFPYTGEFRQIAWQSVLHPVPNKAEKALLDSGALIRRGEFGFIENEKRIQEIEAACEAQGLTMAQGMSLRKQTLVKKSLASDSFLKRKVQKIDNELRNGVSILNLAVKYDLAPVSMIRAVLVRRARVMYPKIIEGDAKKIVKAIIGNELASPVREDFLNQQEQTQLERAKAADTISYSDYTDNGERDAATDWEDSLYHFLNEQGVHFVTEEALRDAGSTKTPDCLVLDDIEINGCQVRWMDCKNYYGTRGVMHRSAMKQIQKYTDYFGGPGAIVFRHGFSQSLPESFQGTLLLDPGPLVLPQGRSLLASHETMNSEPK